MTPTKRCTKCGNEYPATLEHFVKKSSRPDGLDSWCRICKSAYTKKKYDENPELMRERVRKSRAKNPEIARESHRRWVEQYPERMKESKRKYREANLERILAEDRERNRKLRQDPVFRAKKAESDRRYREKNIEKDRQHSREYRKNNRERVMASIRKWHAEHLTEGVVLKQRRFARKRSLPDTLSITEWQNAINHWNGCCAYCGKKPDLITLDHYVPLNHADCPGTVVHNCIPACHACNSSKHDTEAVYWLSWKFGKEHAKAVQARILAYFESLKS